MTINKTDIKLLQSERMADTSNGGGRRTSRVVVDGLAGNIFPKVSRLNSTYGKVNLRKIFGSVVTENLDVYAGAHAVITDAPDNDRIHVNLFSTESDYDTRIAARDRIESYVVAGPESRMVIYGRQLVGQQALLVYQRLEESLPEVGEVYCLSKEVGGATIYQQYVRVINMTHDVRTLTDGSGDFDRRVISLQIGAPLRYEFVGVDVPNRYSAVAKQSLLRSTTVADAARYFGIKKLTEAAGEDDLTVSVESVYSPIVPTTQRESAISLADIGGALGSVSTADVPTPYVGGAIAMAFEQSFFCVRPPKPGTLRVRLIYAGSASTPAVDDAEGSIGASGVAAEGYLISGGTVNYETGLIRVNLPYYGAGVEIEVSYVPQTNVSQPSRTKAIEVTLGTRGTVYLQTLNPLPAPGTLIVDYRALGKWYRLRDNGIGEIAGNDPAYGVGTVSYVTGALVVTLGALPDVDSSVLISWGSPVDYEIRAGDTSDAAATLKQSFTLTNLPVKPASLSLTYTCGVTTYTADADSAGVITGAGVVGTVNHTTGAVLITYTTRLPNSGSVIEADYQQLDVSTPGGPPIVESGPFFVGSSVTPFPGGITVGSFSAQIPLEPSTGGLEFVPTLLNVTDNGSGSLVIKHGQDVGRSNYSSKVQVNGNQTVGTINYITGELTFNGDDIELFCYLYAYEEGVGFAWNLVDASCALSVTEPSNFTLQSDEALSVDADRDETFSTSTNLLYADLTTTTADAVIPGSVLFTITSNGTAPTSRTFFDRNGTLYTNAVYSTGAATACGTINYETGVASLSGLWPEGGTTHAIALLSCLTVYGDFSAAEAFFRTSGSPLRPGSFYVQASALDGTLISGVSDNNGTVTGAKIRGQVVQQMGVVAIEFGELDGSTWVPIEIAPSTLRYSTVVLSNLPLNADILGLDPVRLPSDGRVPIYRPADVVVIHNTQSFTLPNPAVAAATYNVGRTGLSDLWLVDSNGLKVATSKYAANLDTGIVTMAADLSLTDYLQPLKAKHRVEEMQLLSDVQINGLLSLTSPLSRDYPEDSYVSSALLFGDLYATVPTFFDQGTWTGVWQDTVIGSQATAQYNDIDYPVEMLNDGAVTDRWRLNFTSGNPSSGTASFQIISENLGVIGTGNTGADCAPVNTLTEKPYFMIRAAGWGLGWSVGNQLRFDTDAASRPIWISRTVLPGATLDGDSFDLQVRGDVDA